MTEEKKIETKSIPMAVDAHNIFEMAVKEIRNPGMTMAFGLISNYLSKIATRVLEVNDPELIRLCKCISIIKES